MLQICNFQRCTDYKSLASKYIGLFISYVLEQRLQSISSGKLQVLSNFPDIQ